MGNIQAIDRVALQLGSITVHWYGVIIVSGMILGWVLASKEAKRLGLYNDVFSDLLLWAIPISIISARLYYVVFKWEYFIENPGESIAIWQGGIAIHGALIGAVITAIIFSKKKEIPFWKLADIAAPSIILGQAIGRWGNFINQEAHGSEVSRSFLEGLYLPDFIINQMYINGTYFQPTFLYESIWNIIGFVALVNLRRFRMRSGELFLSYIIWYSVGRFFIEGMRTDSLMLTESLRIAQVMSLLLIAGAIILIVYRRLKGKPTQYNADYV